MVQQVIVAAIEAEIEHDARTGRLETTPSQKAPRRPAVGKQFAMRPHRIHIGYHGPERDDFAVIGLDAGDRAALVESDPPNADVCP